MTFDKEDFTPTVPVYVMQYKVLKYLLQEEKLKVIVSYMYIFRDYKFYFACENNSNGDAVRESKFNTFFNYCKRI